MCAFRLSFGFLLFAVALLTDKISQVKGNECQSDFDCGFNQKCCHKRYSYYSWNQTYCGYDCPSVVTSWPSTPPTVHYCSWSGDCYYPHGCCTSGVCRSCYTSTAPWPTTMKYCYRNSDCSDQDYPNQCCYSGYCRSCYRTIAPRPTMEYCYRNSDCSDYPGYQPDRCCYSGYCRSCYMTHWGRCYDDNDCEEGCCSSNRICSKSACKIPFPSWAISLIVIGAFLAIVLPVAGFLYCRCSAPRSHAMGYRQILDHPTSNVEIQSDVQDLTSATHDNHAPSSSTQPTELLVWVKVQ